MIGNWNNSGVIFAALPTILASGTGPSPYNTGVFPLYYYDSTIPVSGTFIDMPTGYGYSGNFIQSDGSGYLHTDYPYTLSPTSISTIEATVYFDYNLGALGGVPYNICGSFADSDNYWHADVTESGALSITWNVAGSGGYVDTDSGVLPNATTTTVFFEKNATDINIYVGSGECVYINESVYDQGTGIFTDMHVLNYNEMVTAFPSTVCKFIAYDRVLTNDEKDWNNNNCGFSGLFGYDSGIFLDVRETAYSSTPSVSYVGYSHKKSKTIYQRYLRGGLHLTFK